MKKMMTLISMIVFAITSYSQDHYVLACFLEEGEATIYKETKTGYVPIVSGNIFCGNILSPKEKEDDYKSPIGVYKIGGMVPYHDDFALPVGYPNEMDKAEGAGGFGIYIHVGPSSNGCYSIIGSFFDDVKRLIPRQELWAFPSRLSEKKLAQWKSVYGKKHEKRLEFLAGKYALLQDCTRQESSDSIQIDVQWRSDIESFSIDTAAASRDSLKGFFTRVLFPDSSTLIQSQDKRGEHTRFSLVQQWYNSTVVPFNRIIIKKGGIEIAEVARIKAGYVITADVGSSEGALVLKEASQMLGVTSPTNKTMVVYINNERIICEKLPFEFRPSRYFSEDGVIADVEPTVNTITIVTLGEKQIFRRCAGERGLFRIQAS
jgi:hypothetical protein